MAHDGVRLRPHHLLCGFNLPSEVSNRGPRFDDALERLREQVESGGETAVEVIEGVDDLCGSCPDCGDGRCESVFGDEEKVRRWDGKILEGLGLSYGDSLTSGELRELVSEKAPLPFCRDRCPWSTVCRVFPKG